MIVTHQIALDPNDQQDTLLRQHAGWARFAWNWGVWEARRALDAGETSATSHYRLRPAFNRIKRGIAPWSPALSQNPAKYALIDLHAAWSRFWTECRAAKQMGRKVRRQYRPPRFHSRKRGMAFRADNGPDTVRCDARTIHLPKIGAVRTREACRFPGPVRECTVKHDGIRWQAAVVGEIEDPERPLRRVAYARVSSADQQPDLGRQKLRLLECGQHQGWLFDAVVTEVGSGLNGTRRKLLKALGDSQLGWIVVEHRDRLARFGFEMVDSLLRARGGGVVVIEDREVDDDLVREMTEVLTSMCARLYGRRSAKARACRALKAAAAS